MICLGIDTSTYRTCVGLVEDGKEIASYELSSSIYNSEEVVNMIKDIFKKIGISINDIDLISVGLGPGSFTGTRIAVTIARTLAQTLSKDIIGVSSLKAAAMSYEGKEDILTLIDAKRNRAYYGLYKNDIYIKTIRGDYLKNIDEIAEELDQEKLVILGAGADVFFDTLSEKFELIMPNQRLIRGANIAKLGIIEYKERGLDNLYNLLPNYINPSQAEEMKMKKEKNAK